MNVKTITCPSCNGTGAGPEKLTYVPFGDTTAVLRDSDPCEDCDGSGALEIADELADEPLGVGEFA